MYKFLFGVSSLLCFVGCGDRNVGGPYDNGGASNASGSAGMAVGGSSANNTPSGGASSSSMSAAGSSPTSAAGGASGAPNQATDPRDEVRAIANKPAACQTDADCCLVVDNCMDAGFVVSTADKDNVRSLLDSANMNLCKGCVAPFVQVSCEANVCVGTSVNLSESPSGSASEDLAKDHCGTVQTGNFTPQRKGTVLGC